MAFDELEARKAGVPDDRNIRAELSYSGKIKAVEIALSENDD